MRSMESVASVDAKPLHQKPRPKAVQSVGCDLVKALVQNTGGPKIVAHPAKISPRSVENWADHRRAPSFEVMKELMVYHDSLFQEFIDHVQTRRIECQIK